MDPKREDELKQTKTKEPSKTFKNVRKTVVFLSQDDSESGLGVSDLPDHVGDNMRMSNFMKDLQVARAQEGGPVPKLDQLKIRGFTKVNELLEGFENDSDFMISNRDIDQSVLNSERQRTGTMMTQKTL